ncbi:MAG: Stp1/IreP family PP2C-type Ser/Thr phosphatase [Bacteroidia bacterium]|nr:Stp1/IreP family PP2C-type Ser/Thr phosphatase [Bacteroidia bacterium]
MNTADPRKFRFGNHTDVGRVRSQNEDYLGFFENQNGAFFVVCDGMGGHAGGAIAAQTAVNSIRWFFEQQNYMDPFGAIYRAIQHANQEIYQKSISIPDLHGMGTTCVLLMIREGRIYYGHVGDSRIYYQHQGKIRPLTRDHSFVQALVDQGVINEDEAQHHPRRNELLRALGTSPQVEVSVADESIVAYAGDMFLLCSDGLTGLVSDQGIQDILNLRSDIQRKAIKLVDLANELGGHDNITVQIIEFTDGKSEQANTASTVTSTPQTTSSFDPPTPSSGRIKSSRFDDPETIEAISETKSSRKKPTEKDIVLITNTDDIDFRPILLRGFLILVGLIVAFLVYQNTFGENRYLGSSGSYQEDSLRALEIENRFYSFFWNSSPKLQRVKEKYDNTREKLRKINDFRKRTVRAVDSLFDNREVRYISNTLKGREESLARLARRYGSRQEWILQANGVRSEEELRQLDTLAIPLEPPNLENDEE